MQSLGVYIWEYFIIFLLFIFNILKKNNEDFYKMYSISSSNFYKNGVEAN